MNKFIQISSLLFLSLIISACVPQPDVPQPEEVSIDNNITIQEQAANIGRIEVPEVSEIEEQENIPTNIAKKVEKKLLVKDSVYADAHKKQAIVENKNSDAFVKKPLFLAPLFTKVEIMQYETENGLWHEQQSVWLKVKKGEIVIKSNPSVLKRDIHKSVLNQ